MIYESGRSGSKRPLRGSFFFVTLSAPREPVRANYRRGQASFTLQGLDRRHLDPAALAQAYERGGASAVSVLTDEDHFADSSADVALVRASIALAVLRKDFTVSENDVLDAAGWGRARCC